MTESCEEHSQAAFYGAYFKKIREFDTNALEPFRY